jgi:hypothetical protein
LRDYIHWTPGQDDPDAYEPLAVRPEDWPQAFERAHALHLSPISIRTHIPPYPACVIDPTGAGDSFCGGFAVGLTDTGDPIRAAQYGTVSASWVIQGYGALYALGSNREKAQARLPCLERLMQTRVSHHV